MKISAVASMSSVQYLREFIRERLTAAAEEIFSEFEKTIVQYEEEISQRRLPDISRTPDIKSHRTDLPQQHDGKEEESLHGQQLCNQERNSSLDQEDPDPPQTNEELEELCTTQEGEQLAVKQEAKGIIFWTGEELDIMWKPKIKLHRIDLQQQHVCMEYEVLTGQQFCNQERNFSLNQEDPEPPQIKEEQEELSSSQEGEQRVLKQETETFTVTPNYEESDLNEPEPNSDQLLFYNCPEPESHNNKERKHVGSGLTRNAEPKKRRRHRNGRHGNNCPGSESQGKTDRTKKSFNCDTCGKTFDYEYRLNQHLRVHTGEKPFTCSTCGRGFSQRIHMKSHMTIHTGEKPYSCGTCEKRFRKKSSLDLHVRIHTGEKPYTCGTCGKGFRAKIGLNIHLRIHTGEKPYSCSICGNRFRDHSILNKHTKIHTDDRPHCCSTCGKRFSQMTHLKTHMRIHTGEKPHCCSTCGKRFTYLIQLKRHMRNHAT